MGNYMVENSWKPEKMNVLNVRKSMFSWPKNMRRMCDSTLISSRFHLEKGCSRWQLWGNLAFLGGGGGNQPQVEIYLGLVCRQTAADGEKLRETITILAIKQTWVWKPLECERETVCFNVVTWKISWCGRWTNNKMEGGTKFDGMGWADRSTTSPFFQKKTNLIGGGLFFRKFSKNQWPSCEESDVFQLFRRISGAWCGFQGRVVWWVNRSQIPRQTVHFGVQPDLWAVQAARGAGGLSCSMWVGLQKPKLDHWQKMTRGTLRLKKMSTTPKKAPWKPSKNIIYYSTQNEKKLSAEFFGHFWPFLYCIFYNFLAIFVTFLKQKSNLIYKIVPTLSEPTSCPKQPKACIWGGVVVVGQSKPNHQQKWLKTGPSQKWLILGVGDSDFPLPLPLRQKFLVSLAKPKKKSPLALWRNGLQKPRGERSEESKDGRV